MTPDEMRRAASLLFIYANPHTRRGESYADESARPQEANHLARLLRELAESSGWRDIATAPRDGTLILCWDGQDRAICAFREGKWDVVHDAESDLWPRYVPTHWQPLPPPPQREE